MTYNNKISCALRKIALALIAVLVLLPGNSCDKNKMQAFRETRVSLYTVVAITIYSESGQKAKAAIDATYTELDRLGRLLNFYSEDSEVSMINRFSGIRPVKVSTDTLAVIDR